MFHPKAGIFELQANHQKNPADVTCKYVVIKYFNVQYFCIFEYFFPFYLHLINLSLILTCIDIFG